MIPITVGAAFTFTFGLIALRIITGRSLAPSSVRAAAFFGAALLVLAIANFELGIISQKVASQQAFEAFYGDGGNSTFALQGYINAVPFLITGAWYSAIGTNVAVTALLFAYIHNADRRLTKWMLAPAIINFSLFSLRDPLIAGAFFFLTLAMFDRTPRRWKRSSEGLLAGASFLLRPEVVVVYISGKISDINFRRRDTIWKLGLLPILLTAAIYGLTWVPTLLGLQERSSLAALPDLLDDFFVRRASRAGTTADGGGSNILGGRLTEMSIFERLPIQVLTFFVLPLPFEITGLNLGLAFIDSLVFITLFRRFWRSSPTEIRRFFVAYVLAVSFFVANYGNLFRLRLPAYFIMIASLLIAASQADPPTGPAPSVSGRHRRRAPQRQVAPR